MLILCSSHDKEPENLGQVWKRFLSKSSAIFFAVFKIYEALVNVGSTKNHLNTGRVCLCVSFVSGAGHVSISLHFLQLCMGSVGL